MAQGQDPVLQQTLRRMAQEAKEDEDRGYRLLVPYGEVMRQQAATKDREALRIFGSQELLEDFQRGRADIEDPLAPIVDPNADPDDFIINLGIFHRLRKYMPPEEWEEAMAGIEASRLDDIERRAEKGEWTMMLPGLDAGGMILPKGPDFAGLTAQTKGLQRRRHKMDIEEMAKAGSATDALVEAGVLIGTLPVSALTGGIGGLLVRGALRKALGPLIRKAIGRRSAGLITAEQATKRIAATTFLERGATVTGSFAAQAAGTEGYLNVIDPRVIREGENVREEGFLESMGRGAKSPWGAFGGAVLGFGLPGGAYAVSGARKLMRAGKAAIKGEEAVHVLRAFEKKFVDPALLTTLGESNVEQLRIAAEGVGLAPNKYGDLLKKVADEAQKYTHDPRLYRNMVEYFAERELSAYAISAGRALPPIVSKASGTIAGLLPLPINEAPGKLAEWIQTKVWPWSRALGIARPDAVREARTALREYAGAKGYTQMRANHVLEASLAMRPEGRMRAGQIQAGLVEGGKVRQNLIDVSKMSPQDRAAAIRTRGLDIAKEGQLTPEELISAFEKDDILTMQEKDSGIWTRLIINEMETLAQTTKVGSVAGHGVYRGRFWVDKQILDALKTGKPLPEPLRMKIRGKAFKHRVDPILELDQRDGGAWWIFRDGKIDARYTDPRQALADLSKELRVNQGDLEAAVSARFRPAKSRTVVEQEVLDLMERRGIEFKEPMTWMEAVERGFTVEAGFPESVRIWEVGDDIAKARLFETISRGPESLVTDLKATGGKIPVGFQEVPNEPAFGSLAGKLVHNRVADHILEIADNGSGKWYNRFYKGWSGTWKATRLAWNSGTHIRNLIDDFKYMNHPAIGMPFRSYVDNLGWAVDEYVRKGPVYREMVKLGVLGGELGEGVLSVWKNHLDEMMKGNDPFAALNSIKKLVQTPVNWYAAEDQIAALASAGYRIKQGDNMVQAAEAVKNAFPDYRLMHRNIPFAPFLGEPGKSKMVNPFFKYTMESVRIHKNAMKSISGWLWLAKWYGAFPGSMIGATLQRTGMTIDELAQIMDNRPSWTGNDWMDIPIPLFIKDEQGRERLTVYDYKNQFPLVDLGAFGNQPLADYNQYEDPSLLSKVAYSLGRQVIGHPIMRALMEGATGISSFTGKTLADPGERPATARAQAVLRQLMPSPGSFGGQYNWQKLRDGELLASRGKLEHGMYPDLRIADTMFGLKLTAAEPEKEARGKRRTFRMFSEEASREIRSIIRQMRAGQMSESEGSRRLRYLYQQRGQAREMTKVGGRSALREVSELLGLTEKKTKEK